MLIFLKFLIFLCGGKMCPQPTKKEKKEEENEALKIVCFRHVGIYYLPASDIVFTPSHIQSCTGFQNCHLVI